jgi:uncharacterized protein involved in exopolysaccharide biosynthesis
VTEAQLDSRRREAVYQPVDPDEIDLIGYLGIIWRYRWMIVALCLVAMATTMAWTLTRPRVYSASTTVVPPLASLQSQSSGLAGGLGRAGSSVLRSIIDTGSIGDIFVEILESREVADAIIDRFDLTKVYKGAVRRSDVHALLRSNTRIEASKEGSIKIGVSDSDPNRCAAIATAYVEELDKRNKRLSTGEATNKRIFLENRLKEIETRLSKVDYTQARDARNLEALEQLLVEQCEMAKIEEAKSMPTIQVLDAAVVPELPMPRGTIRKGMMAGIAAFMLGVFVAFTHEYVRDARRRRQIAIPTGRYDIDLPGSSLPPAQAQSESKDRTAAAPAGQVFLQPPRQQPKRQ